MTKREEFVEFLLKQEKQTTGFIYVGVHTEGHPKPELIVNPVANIEKKLEYYTRAYDENLVLKTFPGISIKQYGWASELGNIDEEVLLDE
jgi:hypothetical protein